MKNIVLTRVDDRLLHGQVVVSWIPYLKSNEVIIIDDEYASDDFMSLLVKSAAPENIKVSILTVDDAAKYLKEEDEASRILLLVRNIDNIKKLIDLKVHIGKVNIGNMGSGKNRKKYYNAIHLSDDEILLLKDIAQYTEVEIKMLPNDKAVGLV